VTSAITSASPTELKLSASAEYTRKITCTRYTDGLPELPSETLGNLVWQLRAYDRAVRAAVAVS